MFKLSVIDVDSFQFISSEISGYGEYNEAYQKRQCLASRNVRIKWDISFRQVKLD
jgi:hypothetical protein